MKRSIPYIRVNSYAPSDDNLYLYFKKVGLKKSDGFAVIDGGEVYVIDGGRDNDEGMLDFLGSLRAKWLGNKSDSDVFNEQDAKLEIHIIVKIVILWKRFVNV